MADATAQVCQYRFHHLLIDGDIYTIFFLLFGAEFAIQLDRLSRRGADGLRIYRRLLWRIMGLALLIGALIFYGIGLGLISKVSPPGFYAIAVTIFATQTGLSHWRLAHHARGPVGAWWRRWTLWRQPLTKPVAAR